MFDQKVIGCSSQEILAQSIIRLYASENGNWTYTGCFGTLTLHFDQTLPAVYLRVVDLKTKKVVLVQECYNDFLLTYQILSPHFHSCEAEDFQLGFCFAEGFDGARWHLMMSGLVKKAGDIKAPQKLAQTTSEKKATSQPTLKKEENGPGFFGSIFSWGKKPETEKKKLKISGPSNVVHVAGFGTHFGDENSGKIPDDWIDIFKKAGLTEKEMKDEKIAKFVLDTIVASEDQQIKKNILDEAKTVEESKKEEKIEEKVEDEKIEDHTHDKPVTGPPKPPGPPPGPPPPKPPGPPKEPAPKKRRRKEESTSSRRKI